MPPKILAFAGSSRQSSLNRLLLAEAAQGARDAGAEVTVVRLADLALPVYDGDVEAGQGLPEGAITFKHLLGSHDALLIASPEHNGGYTAMLKNALDWASRPLPGERDGLTGFRGKLVALVSASPGLLGGIRSQTALYSTLHKLGTTLIPESFALGSAHHAFDEHGVLKDEHVQRTVSAVGAALVSATAILLAGRSATAV